MKLTNPPGFGSSIRSFQDWTTPSSFNAVVPPSQFATQVHANCLAGDIIVVQGALLWVQSVAANAGNFQISDVAGQTSTIFATTGFGDGQFASNNLAVGENWQFVFHIWGRVVSAGSKTIQAKVGTKTTSILQLVSQGWIQSWTLKGS